MADTYTLYQKKEQLRWHPARHGAQHAVSSAIRYAEEHGLNVPAEHAAQLPEQLTERYGPTPENLFIGFYESGGQVHPGIAIAAFTRTSAGIHPQRDRMYSSSHLGLMQVSHTNSEERGFMLMYRSHISDSATLSLIFSGPPGTGSGLAEASHSLVDDFALSMLKMGARP